MSRRTRTTAAINVYHTLSRINDDEVWRYLNSIIIIIIIITIVSIINLGKRVSLTITYNRTQVPSSNLQLTSICRTCTNCFFHSHWVFICSSQRCKINRGGTYLCLPSEEGNHIAARICEILRNYFNWSLFILLLVFIFIVCESTILTSYVSYRFLDFLEQCYPFK
jgi:hypothetical protein